MNRFYSNESNKHMWFKSYANSENQIKTVINYLLNVKWN